MPTFPQIAAHIDALTRKQGPNKGPYICDEVRREYLSKIHTLTGRNVIQYTSGWLHKDCNPLRSGINPEDMHGFMSVMYGIDTSLGLDLILHSPGGQPDAVESFVHYLRKSQFQNVRVFVPHLAMSAACMMIQGFDEVSMGDHSFLGPTDPQIQGVPAHSILQQYKNILADSIANPSLIPLFANMMPVYGPGLLAVSQRFVDLSFELPRKWLEAHMFEGDPDAANKAERTALYFSNAGNFNSHGKHISRDEIRIHTDLKVSNLEDNDDLQDAVLSAHHAACITLLKFDMVKIIENHNGDRYFAAG
jgi:hypothetical protein